MAPDLNTLDVPRCQLGEGAAYHGEGGLLTWLDISASLAYERADPLVTRYRPDDPAGRGPVLAAGRTGPPRPRLCNHVLTHLTGDQDVQTLP